MPDTCWAAYESAWRIPFSSSRANAAAAPTLPMVELVPSALR